MFLPGVQAEVGSGITSITNIKMDEVNQSINHLFQLGTVHMLARLL